MRTKKSIIWGVILVLAAVFLLVSQMGLIPELTLGFWTIVWTFVSLSILINGITKFRFSGIFFGLAFLAIIYDEMLGITQITPMPVLGAALLLSIGCHMLFPKRKHEKIVNMYVTKDDDEGEKVHIDRHEGYEEETRFEGEEGECLEFTQVFKNGTKYVQSPNLKTINVESIFGSMEIYLNNAHLAGGVATLDIDNVFANTTIYVPASWIVEERTECVFGNVSYKGSSVADGRNRLILTGDVVFGNVKIVHI